MVDVINEKNSIDDEIRALNEIQKIAQNDLLGVCNNCVIEQNNILSEVISNIFLFQLKMLKEFFVLIDNKFYYSANLIAGVLFENYISLFWIIMEKSNERAQYFKDYSLINNIRDKHVSSETLKILSKFLKNHEKNPHSKASYFDSWRLSDESGKLKPITLKSICEAIGKLYEEKGGEDISQPLRLSYHIYCSYKHCEPINVINHNIGERDNLVEKRSATQLTYFSMFMTLRLTYFYFYRKDLDDSHLIMW